VLKELDTNIRGETQALLSGVFRENQALIEAMKCLETALTEVVEELDP
jgi:hypothetical protein